MDELQSDDFLADSLSLFLALFNQDYDFAQAIINAQGQNSGPLFVAMVAWFTCQLEIAGVDPEASARASLERLQET